MISFVIPVFNGSKILKENIAILTDYLNKNSIKDYEIILVDDGSTDNTIEIAKNLSGIKLVSYSKNMGKGYALKHSSEFVKGETVIFMDLDIPSQTDLNIIKKMIGSLKEDDLVIGSRYLEMSNVKRKRVRLFLSKVYRLSIDILFPSLSISDTDFGLKAFRTDVFNSLNIQTKDNKWSWDLEMLLLAKKGNKKIKEVPVSWQEEGGSTFGIFKGPLEQLISTLKVKFRYF